MKTILLKEHFCEGEFPIMVEVLPYKELEINEWYSTEFSELTLIMGGECIHHCNNEHVSLQAEDMLLVHPGTIHRFEGNFKAISLLYDRNTPYSPIISGDLDFADILYSDSETDERNQAYPIGNFPECDFVLIENILLRLRYELRHRRIGHDLITMALFSEAIAYIARGCDQTLKSKDISRLQNVVLYMNDHYGEKIDFNVLAQIARVSKRTLFYHFRSKFSMTPLEYLTQIRLLQAKKMLQQGFSVSEVSFKCGFHDSSHLSKVFKAKKGILPSYFLHK